MLPLENLGEVDQLREDLGEFVAEVLPSPERWNQRGWYHLPPHS